MSTPTQKEAKDFEKRKVVPFKLCFPARCELGRSDRQQVPKNASAIASKFYTKGSHVEDKAEVIQEKIEKMKLCVPKERYESPVTENQRYGWYQDKAADTSNKYWSFAKNTNRLISEHLMNYENIRVC